MSSEDDLSAELIPCDRADSHAKHGSAIMIMAWRSAAPRSCWKCKSRDQLEVERSTFSKIRDGSTVGNRLLHRTAVADLRWHSRCAVQLILHAPTKADVLRGRTPYIMCSLSRGNNDARERCARFISYFARPGRMPD